MGSYEQRLTEQLVAYAELAGGGLPPAERYVRPEPPFAPFAGYRLRAAPGMRDEGRRPGRIGGFLERTRAAEAEAEPLLEDALDFREDGPERVAVVRMHPEEGQAAWTREAVTRLLGSSAALSGTLSFELLGTAEEVRVQWAAGAAEAEIVRAVATAHLPRSRLSVEADALGELWQGPATASTGFRLERPAHFPVLRGHADPVPALAAALGVLREGEIGVVQVIFEPARHAWADSLLRCVRYPDGTPVFEDGGELLRSALLKAASPLFGATVRAAAVAGDEERALSILRRISACLGSVGESNRLVPHRDGDAPSRQDFLDRRTRRFGVLLNAEELATLASPPCAGTPKLFRRAPRTKEVPAPLLASAGVRLGTNEHLGRRHEVRVPDEARLRHMHLLGASGMGKSTLMADMLRQDMERGAGLAVIDPHGDLVEAAAEAVPAGRLDDAVLLDPSDEDFPIAFNVLSAHSELEKGLLASDLCSVFRSFATSWGDQMSAILGNAILAFLESPRGGTLADLRRFLVEKPYRSAYLAGVGDPEVRYFWERQYPLLSGRPEGSVVTRLNAFLRPKPIRFMVSQRESRLDLARLMDESKILLVRLPIGLMGEENARLFGSLLVAKFAQLAMGRQAQRASGRRPFWLYVDECHHFTADSVASILSGARKYGLGLVLAHQGMAQIEEANGAVADAISANAHTRICFRLGDRDARRMADGFSGFEASDLVSLPVGRAIGRVGGADMDFSLAVGHRSADEPGGKKLALIRERSRALYGRPKAEVAAELAGWREPTRDEPAEDAVAPPAQPAPDGTENAAAADPPPASLPPLPEASPPLAGTAAPPTPEARPEAQRPGPEPDAAEESRHRSLRNLLKLQAEGMNFRAVCEEPVEGGFVDLVLEKGGRRIAIEISVGNDARYEARNVAKCLRAGFDRVCLVSEDPAKLASARAKVGKAADPADLGKLAFCGPEEALELVVGWAAEAESSTTETMGWRVTTAFEPPSAAARERIRREVDEAVGRAIRRKRGQTAK